MGRIFWREQTILESKERETKEKQSSLWILLLPWLMVWIAIPIHSYWEVFSNAGQCGYCAILLFSSLNTFMISSVFLFVV